MAVIVVMAALLGAGVWVAIRVESGLDKEAGAAPLRRRLRCELGDNRRNAGGGSPRRPAHCQAHRDTGHPAITRPVRQADSALHRARGPAGPARF